MRGDRGGAARSSAESSVMGLERRGCVVQPWPLANWKTGGACGRGKAVQATVEHREPCDSRGSCTVLGAPGGEIPPGDSTIASICSDCERVRSRPMIGPPPWRLMMFDPDQTDGAAGRLSRDSRIPPARSDVLAQVEALVKPSGSHSACADRACIASSAPPVLPALGEWAKVVPHFVGALLG